MVSSGSESRFWFDSCNEYLLGILAVPSAQCCGRCKKSSHQLSGRLMRRNAVIKNFGESHFVLGALVTSSVGIKPIRGLPCRLEE